MSGRCVEGLIKLNPWLYPCDFAWVFFLYIYFYTFSYNRQFTGVVCGIHTYHLTTSVRASSYIFYAGDIVIF